MQDAKRIRLKANLSKPSAHIGPIVMAHWSTGADFVFALRNVSAVIVYCCC